MKQLISETIYLTVQPPIDNITIEKLLNSQFGEIIRWAIVAIDDNQLRICLTYKQKQHRCG